MPSQTSHVCAAVVQAAPIAFEREQTLDKVALLAAEAAKQGAATSHCTQHAVRSIFRLPAGSVSS
jgi:hypothetical protein